MRRVILAIATVFAFTLASSAFAVTVYPSLSAMKEVVGATATIVGDGVKLTANMFPPEFIPAPISSELALVPETTIASAAISGMAKKLVMGGVAGIAAGYAFDELLKGVDFVMKDGVVSHQSPGGFPVPTDASSGQYAWNGAGYTQVSSALGACAPSIAGGTATLTGVDIINDTTATCHYQYQSGGMTHELVSGYVYRSGSSCPANSTYSSTQMACLGTGLAIPITAADLSVLDGFVKNKDGTWQRDLATQMCGSVESCYKALLPSTVLTGPSTIAGKPQTITTTSPGGTVSTTVKTPTTTVTYGPNWYDYNPVTTTTTTNNGGTTTTTDDAPQTFPNVPDMLGGANGGLGGIKDGIPGTTSSTSPIPYMAWYSFSQQCSEITLVIPVHGPFSTSICPVYATYIWPTLYFFFAVFTWIRCWEIWRNTVLRVRAS